MSNHHQSIVRFRQGSVLNLVLIGLLFVIILGVGTWLYLSSSSTTSLDEPLTTTAQRGLFIKEVLDQGEIQSSENVEIRCKVKSRYGSRGVTVKDLVEEGTLVKGGDFLIELRSDEIKENYDKQTMAVNNAKDAKTAAENNLLAAEIALTEYQEGKYSEQLQVIDNTISEATEELETAKEYLKFSEKLQAKNYITPTQLRADEAKVLRWQRALSAALKSKEVLEKHTKRKMETELNTAIEIAKSKLNAAEDNLKIETATLAEIEEQRDACIIRCPEGKSGQVVYANIFSRRGSSEFVLEEGASVREGQILIKLPNPDKMQIKATVNESRITSIDTGMAVNISVDALNGRELEGVVKKVNQYAEPEGWGGGGVRKYGVYIDILNPIKEIKPGMNSSVLIETERLENALQIPIQCVYGYRGKTFCLVKKGGVWETVEVGIGSNNDSNVVIESGLEEGDEVAQNPAGFKHLLDLPDLPEIEEDNKKGKRRGTKQKGKKQSGKKTSNGKSSGKDETKEPSNEKKSESKDDSKSEESGDTDQIRSKNSPGGSIPNPSKKKSGDRDSGPNDETAKKPPKSDDPAKPNNNNTEA